MPIRRLATVLAAAALAALTLAPAAAADQKHSDDHSEEKARSALERARKASKKRPKSPAVIEAVGTVATTDVAHSSFDVNVTQANDNSLRGHRMTVRLGSPSYVTVNGAVATLADVRANDKVRLTGLVDTSTNVLVAYVAVFTRPLAPPPAPSHFEGPVASTSPTTNGFVVTYKGQGVPLTLGSVCLLSLNDQPTTLADVKVGDRADVTAVPEASTGRLVAYVVRFSRPTPPIVATRLVGTVSTANASASSVTLTVGGTPTNVTAASPSIIVVNGVAATLADVRAGDQAVVTGVRDTTGTLVAYLLTFSR